MLTRGKASNHLDIKLLVSYSNLLLFLLLLYNYLVVYIIIVLALSKSYHNS